MEELTRQLSLLLASEVRPDRRNYLQQIQQRVLTIPVGDLNTTVNNDIFFLYSSNSATVAQ